MQRRPIPINPEKRLSLISACFSLIRADHSWLSSVALFRVHIMSYRPEVAILVSSYQRPGHLRRALLSIAMQRDVDGKMEVVVTDDGSTDETPEMVREFAQTIDFPVRVTTHPHRAFQLARCRNEGVAPSTAPYILFSD